MRLDRASGRLGLVARRSGIPQSVWQTVVISVVSVAVTLVVLGDPLVAYRVGRRVRSELETAGTAARDELREGGAPDEVADRVGAETGSRLTIVDRAGTPLGDTGLDGDRIAEARSHVDLELVRRARIEGVVVGDVRDPRTHERRTAVFVDVGDGRVVQASRSTGAIESVRTSLRELLVLGLLVAAAIALAVAFVVVRSLVTPARELRAVADSLARGDLSVRTRTERDDELGDLGRAIDGMAEQLAQRVESLQVEEGRLITVLDAMTEGVFVTDERGRIVTTNAALEKLLHTRAVGKTAIEAIRSPELHRAVLDAQAGRPSTVEFELRLPDESHTLEANVAPLPTSSGVVAVLHDVTRLQTIDRVRRDFVANASHELRTPLTAIRRLRRDAPRQRARVSRVGGACSSTSSCVTPCGSRESSTTSSSLSRAESPEFRLELAPTDVTPIVVEVVRGLDSQARKKYQQLAFVPGEEIPQAMTNEGALDQVLVNLVDNAIKYTPEGGAIHVRTLPQRRVRVVEVHNSGPGIPEQHLDRIFERFYRVDAGRSRDQGGTGLGLSIVKHLALRMRADVTVESPLGQGTTFRIFLPTEA